MNERIIIIENSKIVEAKAWVIKYFREASEEYMFLVFDIKGIIERRLISSPIHILSQEYDEIEIKVPIIKKFRKIILLKFIIKKKRIDAFMNRVWTY